MFWRRNGTGCERQASRCGEGTDSMERNGGKRSAKYVGIWQDPGGAHDPWLNAIFGDVLSESVADGNREVVRDGAILFDHFVTSNKDDYYSKFRGLNAFLVDTLDEFYDFDPKIYANFRGVIRMYWSDVFRPERVRILPLGPGGIEISGVGASEPATSRQYVWSFLGQINKSSRPEMAYALGKVEPHLLFATDNLPGVAMWNRGAGGPRRYSRSESAAILGDSIFAPCPMGNANMECFRVYEALELGTIPVLEKRRRLDYFTNLWGEHPVPAFDSWKEAARWMGAMLERPGEIDALQSRCVEWWRSYKKSYSVSLGEFLAECSARDGVAKAEDYVYPKFSRPAWQIRELLRHHNAGALRRRVMLQLKRLRKRGRFRISSNAGPA